MDITEKLLILDNIYKIYGDFMSGQHFACKKYCTACCTRNVTLTTLEGAMLVEYMEMSGQTSLFGFVKSSVSRKRFCPEITTNQIAQFCIQGEEISDEEIDPAWGKCPLLEKDACPVYDARPFGCRCLVSKTDCRKTGYAEIDPVVLTINDIFLQHIEHLDHQGLTGNLSDIMLFLEPGKKRNHYAHRDTAADRLIQNHPLRVLMIPPEYRNRIKPILESLKNILP